MEIEKHMDGGINCNSEKSRFVLNIVFDLFNDQIAHQFINEVFILQNTSHIHQSASNRVPGKKYLILGLPGIKILVCQV